MRLGTIDSKNHPQIHPVWYHYANDWLYLMTGKNTRKLQNVKGKSTVYFSIDTDATLNRGVRGKGTAQIIKESGRGLSIAEKKRFRSCGRNNPVLLLCLGLR